MTAAAPLPLDRVALTIGVTGHRDIPPEHIGALRAAFAAILDEVTAKNPSTPVVVLSGLAAGADTLAAEVALERNLPVVACLPMTAEEYLADFPDPAERARFLAMLAACARVDVVSDAADRRSRYLDAGLYVSHYSHVLVAFWDGAPARGRGGTAEVVEARLSAVRVDDAQSGNVAGLPDAGPVFRIATPRRGGTTLPDDPGTVLKLFPERFSGDVDFERDFDASLARLDAFNRDLPRLAAPNGRGASLATLRDRTSELATQLQTTTFRFLYALYITALVATAAQYTTNQVLKFAMFPVAFVAYRIAKRFDYENRYQDYRALSEGMRVQSAWFAAGLREEPADRCYLGMQERELQWIRLALRYAFFAFRPAAGTGSVTDAACREWIEGQWTYFKTKPRREERWLRRLEFAARAAFWGALTISLALFAFLYLPTAPHTLAQSLEDWAAGAHLSGAFAAWIGAFGGGFERVQTAWDGSAFFTSGWFGALHAWDAGTTGVAHSPQHAWLVRLSTGVLALYAALAILISNYSDKRGFASSVKRYDRMFVVFDRARARLAAMPDPNVPLGREVVRELGRAALIENADWLLTRREHPLAFVT